MEKRAVIDNNTPCFGNKDCDCPKCQKSNKLPHNLEKAAEAQKAE